MTLSGKFLERHDDSVDNSFRARGAARHIDIHGDYFVNTAENVIAVMEHSAGRGACADCDYHLRARDLLIEVLEHTSRTPVDRAGNQQHIRMLGVAHIYDAETFYVVERSQTSKYFDVTAVAGAVIEMHDPG
jgi:hypothetical protein